MGETVEGMLKQVMLLLPRWDPAAAAKIAEAEGRLDRMNHTTKAYLARLDLQEGDPDLLRRVADLVDQAAQYEAVGDGLARMTFGLARKTFSEGVRFSPEGLGELSDFHDLVLFNPQAALHVQMTRNPAAARDLVSEKEYARQIEQKLQRAHLARLRSGNPETASSTNIHQEVLRELKQVNTCFIMVAYPILTESGDLLETRLKRSGN
jgi:phosphate:Na+ symporter